MVSQLRSRIESVLLVIDAPVAVEELASALGATDEVVAVALHHEGDPHRHLTRPAPGGNGGW